MAAECKTKLVLEFTGLGEDHYTSGSFTTTTTPSKVTYNYRQQAVADTEEALDLGGVSTVHLIVFHCVANDADIDTSYAGGTFAGEIECQEGEWCVFKPTGTVYVKNDDVTEQTTYEYWCIGV